MNYHYCYNQYIFFSFSYSLIFSHRVPSNMFQKLLLHIFEKRKRLVWQQECLLPTGIWLSLHRNWRRMEVYQTWNSKALYSEYLCVAHWFMEDRRGLDLAEWKKLNISKWRDSKPDANDDYAEISKNGGLFTGINMNDENAYICEIPGGKITFQP